MSKPDHESDHQPGQVFPVRSHERIELIDVLRGFAVFGILVANLAPYSGQAYGLNQWPQVSDRLVFLLIRLLVEAKFYSLFSFLFGWGMAVQMARAQARGVSFWPRYIRRMLILLLFGIIHGALIWHGDILTFYALLGLLLLAFRKRSERFLLVAAGIALLISILLTLPIQAVDTFREWYVEATSRFRLEGYSDSVFRDGTYLEITRRRLQDYIQQLTFSFFAFGNVFAMFLLGLALGKRRLFHNLKQNLPLIRKVLWPLFGVGLIFNGVFVSTIVWPDRFPAAWQGTVRVGARTIGAPALMLFYICAITLLFQQPQWRDRLTRLAPVGRTALSNYVLQSIICTLLFYDYGLNFYGRVDPTAGLVLAILIFISQISLSRWWLERYQFGPLEWLWRSLTYGHVQSLKIRGPFKDEHDRSALSAGARRAAFLAGAYAVLILWAVALMLWNREQKGDRVQPAQFFAAIRSSAILESTAIPSPEPTSEPTAVSTPVVQAVPYRPGIASASGDLTRLADLFDVDRAFDQIATLTGPPYNGRLAGSPEGWAAGQYLADQFQAFRLRPVGKDDSFFQTFPVTPTVLESNPRLVIIPQDGSSQISFLVHQGFNVVAGGYAGEGEIEAGVVWVDNCERSDFDNIVVVDKIVLCRRDRTIDADRNAIEHGAGGLMLLVEPSELTMDMGYPRRQPYLAEPIPTFWITPDVAGALLQGSDLTLQDLLLTFTPRDLQSRARMEVDLSDRQDCEPTDCLGRNVLGVLPGRDPAYSDEVVILSAHYDHMGQDPDGTIWPGANDDASGVAVLLEIARAWQAEGYVPRRTVLFAAWDGEESGLLGARYYVQNPIYPLEQTKALIQLDMVGAGGSILLIDGHGGLATQIQAVAETYAVETVLDESGGSDHVPFLQAGVPANMLIWMDPEGMYDDYHRPLDRAERIDPTLLDSGGKIAHFALLSIVEAEPAIQELLQARREALLQGELEDFLATSSPDQRRWDQLWFTDAAALNPVRFDLELSELLFRGNLAQSQVNMHLTVSPTGDPEQEEIISGTIAVRFQHTAGGWRWAGSDLKPFDLIEQVDPDSLPAWAQGIDLFLPDPESADLSEPILQAISDVEGSRQLLDLTMPDPLRIEMHRSPSDLALSTLPSLGNRAHAWFGPGTIKLILSDVLADPGSLEDALIQASLFEAGLKPEIAPQLWQGIPLALREDRDPMTFQPEFLPDLYRTLLEDNDLDPWTAAWAAASFLRTQYGWRTVGNFVKSIGASCEEMACDTPEAFEGLLSDMAGLGSPGFEGAWKAFWYDRLDKVREALGQVLLVRSRALEEGDERAFLSTVDPDVPYLLNEERAFFTRATEASQAEFQYSVEPRVLLEDGGVIARVTFEMLENREDSSGRSDRSLYQVLFTPSGLAYQWAGMPMQRSIGDRVQVLYPREQQELAAEILAQIEEIYSNIAVNLRLNPSPFLTIKMYPDSASYRNSISPYFQSGAPPAMWIASGQSLKLVIPPDGRSPPDASLLTQGVIRHVLLHAGIESEWMLRGMSLYLNPDVDGGARAIEAMRYLRRVASQYRREQLIPLTELPGDDALSVEDQQIANAQAWDAMNYLVETYGYERLVELVQASGSDREPSEIFSKVIGVDPDAFAEDWLESHLRGHTQEGWIALAEQFDPENAMREVETLADERFAGRLAGSSGARAAAQTIAEAFERYGLLPVAPPLEPSSEPTVEPGNGEGLAIGAFSPEAGETALEYFQRFPIFHQELERAPSLSFLNPEGDVLANFIFRQDFHIIPQAYTYAGPVQGEVVWIPDEGYAQLDLSGKIVMRNAVRGLRYEVQQAVSSGAAGLILITEDQSKRAFLAKHPFPTSEPEVVEIPVFLLSSEAFQSLSTTLSQNQTLFATSEDVQLLNLFAMMDLPLSRSEQILDVNVLGLLPGSDPTLSKEIVILGSHYDHVGDDPERWLCQSDTLPTEEARLDGRCTVEPGLRYPGANDSASGISVLLEIARIWHEAGYQPSRSVLFAAWGAQEAGENGSRYYAAHPLFPLNRTLAMIQLDSVGGGRGHYLEVYGVFEQDGLLVSRLMLIEDMADASISILQRSLAEASRSLQSPLEWLTSPSDELEDDSDHIPFRELGIPSVLLRWRGASVANWPQGEADQVSPENLGAAGRLVLLLVMSLAQ